MSFLSFMCKFIKCIKWKIRQNDISGEENTIFRKYYNCEKYNWMVSGTTDHFRQRQPKEHMFLFKLGIDNVVLQTEKELKKRNKIKKRNWILHVCCVDLTALPCSGWNAYVRNRGTWWIITNFYRALHPTAAEYTFPSSAQQTLSRIDHKLGHKTSLKF